MVQAAAQEPRQEELRALRRGHRSASWRTYLAFKETEQSKIFPNEAFGYWKVTVERPLRLHSQLTPKAIETLRFASGDEDIRSALYDEFGDALFDDFAKVKAALEKRLAEWGAGDGGDEDEGDEEATKKGLPEKKKKKLLDPKTWERDGRLVEAATKLQQGARRRRLRGPQRLPPQRVDDALDKAGIKLAAADLKQILRAVSWRDETAPPVIAKVHKPGKATPDPLHGRFEATVDGKRCVVEYEPDTDLRDTEQVPLLEEGGIEAFIRREVLPYTPDAWIDESKTPDRLRGQLHAPLLQAAAAAHAGGDRADILAIEKEAEGLLEGLVKRGRGMIEELKPYAQYRATRRAIGFAQVPAHWEIMRGKRVFAETHRSGPRRRRSALG